MPENILPASPATMGESNFCRAFVVSKARMGLAASCSTSDELVEKVRKALIEIQKTPDHQDRIEKMV
jgi:tripartite-type tricarboxylate transporter receptor subunit TctC